MRNINHRNIQLLDEGLNAYNTTIECKLPMPKYLLDTKGRLFQKAKTIHEAGEPSRVLYSEVLVTNLSSVEVAAPPVDAHCSVVR